MEESGRVNSSVPGTDAHTVTLPALQFDLNHTPPPSPPTEPHDDGATDHRRASSGRKQEELAVCSVCGKHFNVESIEESKEESEAKCAECSTECRRLRRSTPSVSGGARLRLFDINASPPPEVDDDEEEVFANTENPLTNKMQDKCTSTSPNTRPPGNAISSNIPCGLVGNVLQKADMLEQIREVQLLAVHKAYLFVHRVVPSVHEALASCFTPRLLAFETNVSERHMSFKTKPIIESSNSMGISMLRAYDFIWRFHNVLGLETPLSLQKLEYELLNPWIDGINSKTISDTNEPESNCQSQLSHFHMAMVKMLVDGFFVGRSKKQMLVEDMLSEFVINDPYNAMELKSKKGKKRNTEVNLYGKKSKIGIFPLNEVTWPELARRYLLVYLSVDDKFENLEITSHGFNEFFHCLKGNGGPLCGCLTRMAAIEADAVVLAEASKKVFSSMKRTIIDFKIDLKDLNINDSATENKRTDNKCPGWIKVLEPVRKYPTNVGGKIKGCVQRSLDEGPPAWATKRLKESISKNVYKSNAAGPTKKMVIEVLEIVRNENSLTKRTKESRIINTVSDVIIKRCRMVLRTVAAEDQNKSYFNLLAESFLKLNESDDVGNLVTISRPLDFRTIDLRLDAGSYGDSHESFIEDVREVLQNLRINYRNELKHLQSIDEISRKLEALYEQEVLAMVNKMSGHSATSSSDETKEELNMMIAETISATLLVAPWEEGICKICGKDENDDVLLLCDRCDGEYHTYCLNPPLQRIPKSEWYCPPCSLVITSQSQNAQPEEMKKRQREFTQKGLEALAGLADSMGSTEYWELGVKERVSLLNFLCEEALGLPTIREQINTDNSASKSNFLGRDSDGRLYWVLGGPERLFVSGPYVEDEEHDAPDESSKECDSWTCYESDAEINALVQWLRDSDARERELKEMIIDWHKAKSKNNRNSQVDVLVKCIKRLAHGTNSRAELEKKFGLFGEQNIYRCDCLELVGTTRGHCRSCHVTFFSGDVHECNGPENQLTSASGLVHPEVGLNPEGINVVNPSSSSGPLTGCAFEITRCLKMILLDIEAALPREAFRPSRVDTDKLRTWREYLKSAQSISEMVQATIILEDMMKTAHLKKEWWYWSSPSAMAKIATVQSLASQIYALDAAVTYEKPPSAPVDRTEDCGSAGPSCGLEPLQALEYRDTQEKKKLKASDD